MGENDFLFDPLKQIFKNRGIDTSLIQDFIEPSEKSQVHFSKLKDIDKAVELLLKHLKNSNRIHIIVDSDADGYCSFALMANYLKSIYSKHESHLTWHVHPSKEHGIILSELDAFKDGEGYSFDLLIVPDGGTNDVKACERLKSKGVDILILDHHNVEKENKHALVINPQLSPEYLQKDICGTAVVYKLLQAIDNKLNLSRVVEYLDLVAIATVADMMDMRILENRYFVKTGLKQINNEYIKALLAKNAYSIGDKSLNGMLVAFNVSPYINAITRVGTWEERNNLALAMIDSKATVEYRKNKKTEPVMVRLCEDMARQSTNIKNRQNRLRDKLVPTLAEECVESAYINFLSMVDEPEYKNLKGVLAMKIADRTKRPTLVGVIKSNGSKIVYTGSGRNIDGHEVEDFSKALKESGLFNFVSGHDNAFGFELDYDKLDELNNFFSNKKSKLIHVVDFSLDSSNMKPELVKSMESLRDMWGTKVKEPKFHIKNILVNEFIINEKRTLMSFSNGSIDYKIFNPTENIINNLTKDSGSVKIDVVGTVSINNWGGNISYQVVVEDYEIVEKNIEIRDVSIF